MADKWDMAVGRLLYVSEAVKPFSEAELAELVAVSSQANMHRGITGLLVCSGSNFLQILEGEDLQVKSLYRKIERDPRHQNVCQLLFRQADSRMFPQWGMHLANAARSATLNSEMIDRTLIRLRLRPGDGQRDALTLLDEFRRQFDCQMARSA
jgi:hypothetical protein